VDDFDAITIPNLTGNVKPGFTKIREDFARHYTGMIYKVPGDCLLRFGSGEC